MLPRTSSSENTRLPTRQLPLKNIIKKISKDKLYELIIQPENKDLHEFIKDFNEHLRKENTININSHRNSENILLKYRRLDSLARILVGGDVCAGVSIIGNYLFIATNRNNHKYGTCKSKLPTRFNETVKSEESLAKRIFLLLKYLRDIARFSLEAKKQITYYDGLVLGRKKFLMMSLIPYIKYKLGINPNQELMNRIIDNFQSFYHEKSIDDVDVSDIERSIVEQWMVDMEKNESVQLTESREQLKDVSIEVVSNLPENVQSTVSREQLKGKEDEIIPQIEGLEYQKIPKDGHCLFNAVALYVGQDQQTLRNLVAARIEGNEELRSLLPLSQKQSVEKYLQDLREGREWADHVEIAVLMKLLDRPIVIIGPDGGIRNRNQYEGHRGEPIFVYYNGHNHYDAFLLRDEYQARDVLNYRERLIIPSNSTLTQLIEHSSKDRLKHEFDAAAQALEEKDMKVPGDPKNGENVKNIIRISGYFFRDLLKVESFFTDINENSKMVQLISGMSEEKLIPRIIRFGGDGVHTEIRFISSIVALDDENFIKKFPKFTELQALKELKEKGYNIEYIGISKLCCAHCYLVMKNETIKEILDLDLDKVINTPITRGHHGNEYAWPISDILFNRDELVKIYLGNSYESYKKIEKGEPIKLDDKKSIEGKNCALKCIEFVSAFDLKQREELKLSKEIKKEIEEADKSSSITSFTRKQKTALYLPNKGIKVIDEFAFSETANEEDIRGIKVRIAAEENEEDGEFKMCPENNMLSEIFLKFSRVSQAISTSSVANVNRNSILLEILYELDPDFDWEDIFQLANTNWHNLSNTEKVIKYFEIIKNTSLINKIMNIEPYIGDTLLIIAIRLKDEELIKVLINNKADINKVNSQNESPIYVAFSCSTLTIIQKLIEEGANLLVGDKVTEKTLLHAAIISKDSEKINFLLKHKIINDLINKNDIYGIHPLDLTITFNQSREKPIINNQLVHQLWEKGARLGQIVSTDGFGKPTGGYTMCGEFTLPVTNPVTNEIIHSHETLVVEEKFDTLFLTLLERFKDNNRDQKAMQAESIAVIQNENKTVLIDYLLNSKPYNYPRFFQLIRGLSTFIITHSDEHERTALHYTAQCGDVLATKLLLENGAISNIDQSDDHGNIPLHYAAKFGDEETVNLLLKYNKKNINLKNRLGATPLNLAIKFKQIAVIKLLESFGALSSPEHELQGEQQFIQRLEEEKKKKGEEFLATINELKERQKENLKKYEMDLISNENKDAQTTTLFSSPTIAPQSSFFNPSDSAQTRPLLKKTDNQKSSNCRDSCRNCCSVS